MIEKAGQNQKFLRNSLCYGITAVGMVTGIGPVKKKTLKWH